MTLEQAVKVLNQHGYRGRRDWEAGGTVDGRTAVFSGEGFWRPEMTTGEAIVAAEELQREARKADAAKDGVQDMTLDDAVKVLNERRHRNVDTWHINRYGAVEPRGAFDAPRITYTAFDAIAIAEKYKRCNVSPEMKRLPGYNAVYELLSDIADCADGPGDQDSLAGFVDNPNVRGDGTLGDVFAFFEKWKDMP